MMSMLSLLFAFIIVVACNSLQIEAAPTVAQVLYGNLMSLEHGNHDKASTESAFKSCASTLDSVLDNHHQTFSGAGDETRLAYMQGLQSACKSSRKNIVRKIMKEWRSNYPQDFREEQIPNSSTNMFA